ncbi:MAG: DEAD/DEAH box helicase [Firmicutes bacterium]|nr:DEAD/DEAH box helicase [Bacillota bacterium]
MSEISTIERELQNGFKTAAIDYSYQSNLAYKPEFLSNDASKGKKVLVSLEQELAVCDEFLISVAFITKSGITPLLQVLKDLERKGIPGKILTTDYLFFSEPEALEKLAGLSNIELRMFCTDTETGGFHTKGYIFRQEEIYHIIVGSSNMTLSAITRNREWNTKFVSTAEGELAREVLQEFNDLWSSAQSKVFEEFIEEYKTQYLRNKIIADQKKQVSSESIIRLEDYNLKPNKMQVAFIKRIKELQKQNAEKALLLSATGTGKSFASAFAMRELNANRVLFVVHREQIAKQAYATYQRVFGSSKTYGLLSGSSRELDAEYLFSTMQMMSKSEILSRFEPDRFDAIVLDECHHAGAESYRRIMSHFKPKLWLGMTASPDTNNYDIYDLFDHNIAYEIRLQQALEEDLLCPFHYFGITDLQIDGQMFDDTTGVQNFSRLVCDERVRYIVENAEYFGHSGDRVKGLIFCSRKEEAKELADKLKLYKKPDGTSYRAIALTGEDSQQRREQVIEQLTDDLHPENQIDYILTVDIFNEGVDVPEINQVIMLRPTQSPVVFIQQLGRGLRKAVDKEYVVIIDFIGNYMNNYMIPIALSGDRSYNKDAMRRYIQEGARIIPGSSTVHFDEISKKRIYESIDAARTNAKQLLKDSYLSLKYKLGRIPSVLEFQEYGSIDVTKFFKRREWGSYYGFLVECEPDYTVRLTKAEKNVIDFLSQKVVSYKRIDDIVLLKLLMAREERLVSYYEQMRNAYSVEMTHRRMESVVRNLTNAFSKTEEQSRYGNCKLIEPAENGDYRLTKEFREMLQNKDFAEMAAELLAFGELQYQENYSNTYKDTGFQLYQKYTYEDVCRLLCWRKNLNAQNIGGYKYDEETKTLPVFINYEKAADAIRYEDRFVSDRDLIAISKHPRRIDSPDADHMFKRTEQDKDNRIFLFVRKNKDDQEAKEFYFLGEIEAEGDPKAITMDGSGDSAFEIHYRLDVPVRTDIYDYLRAE